MSDNGDGSALAQWHVNEGIALARRGKKQEAIARFQEALRARPEHAKAHNNLGIALAELGRDGEAKECWQRALQIEPAYAEAHFNLALACAAQRQVAEAVAHYDAAIRIKPDYADAYNNLGLLQAEQGRHGEGVILLQQAVRLKPDYAEAHNNLGLALVDLGRPAEGLASYQEALRLRPLDASFHNNQGTALAALGRFEEALAAFQQALRLKPNYPEARWHRALALLHSGQFDEGWREYQWRWQRQRARPRRFAQPLWDGAGLAGKRILLYCEQGLGDTLQFIRYAALVKECGGTVLVECPGPMMPLLSTCPGIDELVAEGTALPAFEVQAPLLTLPALFKTTLATIPAQVPYLSAESERVESWRGQLKQAGLKIGIAWQGNPKYRWDRHRSFALEEFGPLSRLEGVQLYSLQKGAGREQLTREPGRHGIIDLGDHLGEDAAFDDCAAIMASLDLVITCDSALGHLAGALGARVWVALSWLSDWRWLLKREDIPWYPTMRLFRQREPGNWEDVFARMAEEIETIRPAANNLSDAAAPGV